MTHHRLIALCFVVSAGLIAGCSKAKKESHHLVVATDAAYQPFEYYDESHELVGFDMDLFRAIAEKAGFTLEFKNQPFDGIVAGLNAGKYDAVISAMTITPERARQVLFTDPYYDAGQVIAIREETPDIQTLDGLEGEKIGVQRGTTGAIKAKEVRGAEIKEYDTIDLAFLALRNGAVNAVINDEPTSRSIAVSKGGVKLVGVPLTDEKYGIALRKDETEIAAKINAALAELKKDGTLDDLKAKWIGK